MSTIRKIPIDVPEPDAVSPTGQTDAAQAETPPEAPEATPAAVSTAADQADMLAAERDALSDALLRQRAEFDNYRRRSVRELAESRDRAQAELLHDLLPVLDNLERALDAAEHHEESKVLGGVRMTRDMFVDQLRRVGCGRDRDRGGCFRSRGARGHRDATLRAGRGPHRGRPRAGLPAGGPRVCGLLV